MALVGDDCYFYYSSGCVRGSQCAFRHQPAAKSTEVTCPEWLKGVCFKPTCLLRHMLVSNTRTQVHCKWEAMPSGCLDPGCTYTHINKKVVMPGTTTVDIKGSSASTVKQPLLSSTLPLAALKFSNDMPALQTNNTILPPNNPIGQMIPAIVMTQANIVEPLPGQVLTPSTVLTVAPQLIPMQQPLIINVPRPHLHASILGPPPILPPLSVFPKNDFQQQVQMFKDFLAQKNKAVEDKSFESNGKREKYKEKYTRHKKERRHGRKSSKDSKRKLKLSKVDEEILFGDYKDIPLEKNEKIEQNDEAIHKINVKSYEEILREKVFRKTMEKRRDKFVEDFKELTSEEKSKKNNELQDNKQKVKKCKKIITSGTNIKDRKFEALNKDDSVELSLDGSAIHDDFLLNGSPRPDKKEIKKTVTENLHNESIEIFIPDETADINISIDENDELVKELNEVAQQKRNSLTRSSITNVIHKNSGHKVKKNIKITSPVKNISSDKANLRMPETAGNKRKVVKIDLHEDKSQIKYSNNKEDPVSVKSDVRVKTFEEIMQEKRKRKVMPNETTSRASSVKKVSLDPLHAKSAKAKTELRRSVVVINDTSSESKKETKDVIKARSTLGLSSVPSEKVKSEQGKNTSLSDVKAALPRKIITIAKPVVNNESYEKSSIGIRSFDDIMREKQLRKQQEKNLSNNNPDKKHPFIKRSTLVKEKAEFIRPSISSSEPKISRETISEKKAVSDGLILNNFSAVNQESTESKPSEKTTNGVGLHKHLNLSDNHKESSHVKSKSYLQSLTEHIKEALEEANRKRDEYLLSDEEFEKEINDLSSEEGDGCINDDIDDDDLIIELAEMIDGN